MLPKAKGRLLKVFDVFPARFSHCKIEKRWFLKLFFIESLIWQNIPLNHVYDEQQDKPHILLSFSNVADLQI